MRNNIWEDYREAKTGWNRSEMPPNAIKTQVIHTIIKGKSILLFFPLILNYSVRSLYSFTNSYNNAITQCHVDDAQRAWASCDAMLVKKSDSFRRIWLSLNSSCIRNGIILMFLISLRDKFSGFSSKPQ